MHERPLSLACDQTSQERPPVHALIILNGCLGTGSPACTFARDVWLRFAIHGCEG
jgi:hypothetical protein